MSGELLLALDIGNTNVTVGLFAGALLKREWRLPTDPSRSARSYGKDIARMLRSPEFGGPGDAVLGADNDFGTRLSRSSSRGGARSFSSRAGGGGPGLAVVMASVVPALSPVFKEVFSRLGLRAVEITTRSPLGVRIRVDIPSQVGADRLLNAVAVHRLFGGPAVVVDFGTATTFDCVSAEGDYLGGAILPGPRLAAKALALHTAKLPEVAVAKPSRVVGKNTVECIQAGLYYGYLGMIERVLKGTIREMGGREGKGRKVRLFATGGMARLFLRDLPKGFKWVPDLTLQGLRLAHEAIRV